MSWFRVILASVTLVAVGPPASAAAAARIEGAPARTWSDMRIGAIKGRGEGLGQVAAARAGGAGESGVPTMRSGAFLVDGVAAPMFSRIVIDPSGPANFEGFGTPGSRVTVRTDGTEIGEAVVGDAGTWAIRSSSPLAAGDHRIAASARVGEAGSAALGQEVRVSIPLAFTGPPITAYQNGAPPAVVRQSSDDLRGRAEALARAASEEFDAVSADRERAAAARRLAQGPASKSEPRATPQRPPTPGPETLLVPLQDWLARSSNEYRKNIIKGLSIGGQPSDVADKQRPAPRKPQEGGEDAGSLTSSAQEWLERANREYQNEVMKKLALPEAGAPAASPPVEAAARKPVAASPTEMGAETKHQAEARLKEEQRLADQKAADEAKKRETEAVAKRQAEAKLKEAQRLADQKAADEAKKREAEAVAKRQAEAKLKEAQRLAEQKAADEAKKRETEAVAKRQAEARLKEEQRLAEQKAADEARKRAAEAVAKPDAQQRTAVAPGAALRDQAYGPTRSPDPRIPEGSGTRGPVDSPRTARPPFAEDMRSSVGGPVIAGSRRHARRGAIRRPACKGAGRRVRPPAYYVVRSGDSLWSIAERHYRRGEAYLKIQNSPRNDFEDPDFIMPCQRIWLP